MIEKILKDRLNHLKSEYSYVCRPKLTKVGTDEEKLILHSKIQELEWLLNKIKHKKELLGEAEYYKQMDKEVHQNNSNLNK